MRVSRSSVPDALTAGLRRASFGALLMLAMSTTFVTSAWAKETSGPKYSLSVVEGESTLPERSIVSTTASVHPKADSVLSIIRNGTVVAEDKGTEYLGLSQIPQPGDVVTLESPKGTTVGSVVYDGLPSIDPTVCAGSTSFSGQRSGAQEVEGGYYTLVLHTDPYGKTSVGESASGQAQVTLLSGSAYSGSFLMPLTLGQTVWASESLETPLAGGAVFTYSSENERPVGACPAPPPPPPAPPAPPALQGSVLKLSSTTIQKLLKSGWRDQVTINQPGTVVQGLYLKGGKLPAFASAHKARKRSHKPAALLLARGSASAAAAGKVSVLLRLTTKGRRMLRHAHSIRAVLVTTLRSSGSSDKLSLQPHSLLLSR